MAPCFISIVGNLTSESDHETGVLITRDEIGDVRRRIIVPPVITQADQKGAKRQKTSDNEKNEDEDDDDDAAIMIIKSVEDNQKEATQRDTKRDPLSFGKKGQARNKKSDEKQKRSGHRPSTISWNQFQEISSPHLFVQANLDHWLKKVPPGSCRSLFVIFGSVSSDKNHQSIQLTTASYERV